MASQAPTPSPTLLPAVDPGCAGGPVELMPVQRAQCLAGVFKALSDPTRVRLLGYLAEAEDGTVCACHLPEALGISQPTLSHHLKKLTQAGVITRHQQGRWAHYTVVAEVLATVRDFLGDQLTTARCC